MTPHRVPYIQGREVVIPSNSKRVTNLEDLEYFYASIKDIPDCNLLDIGANKGYYPLLATIKPDLYFLAFEPVETVYRRFLLWNLKLNGVDQRGQTFNFGFSNETCTATLWYDNTENATLRKDVVKEVAIRAEVEKRPASARFKRYSSIQADFVRLDDTMVDGGVVANDLLLGEPVHAIKLDVEGAESLVIDGGVEFFSRTNALLFVEIEQRHCDRFDTTVDSVIGKLRDVGYVHFVQQRNNWLCTK